MAIIRVKKLSFERYSAILSRLAVHGRFKGYMAALGCDDLLIDIPGFAEDEHVVVRVYSGSETRSGATIATLESYGGLAINVDGSVEDYHVTDGYWIGGIGNLGRHGYILGRGEREWGVIVR